MALPKLGDKAKDRISGFTGIVDSMHHYLNGCVRVAISPTDLDKDGKPIAPHIFDISQTEVVEAGAFAMPTQETTASVGPGGPRDDPPRREAPTR